MSSSPWEWHWNGDEDVATPFQAGQCQDAPAPYFDPPAVPPGWRIQAGGKPRNTIRS